MKIMWKVNGVFALFIVCIIKFIFNTNLTEGLIIMVGSWILLNQLIGFGFYRESNDISQEETACR